MPKMKSKRALMKRIRVTGSGKIKRDCAYRRHLAPNKTSKCGVFHTLKMAAIKMGRALRPGPSVMP